jgi:hypothetical protein
MAVTGQLTRARGVISGRVVRVVVVRAYPEPRIRGIGQVVATVCTDPASGQDRRGGAAVRIDTACAQTRWPVHGAERRLGRMPD